MKTKSLIFSAMLLLGAGVATTSCEDMLEAENKLVTENFAPQDTVYQFNGIIHAMQGVVDQTILLGELRADLVSVNSSASQDLQDLGLNDISTDNAYNNPAAFYNVINNCNIYLANVDTTLISKGEKYFGNEIIAVKCFRAWAYLELAKIYGSVPFVTTPILEANAAEQIVANQKNRQDMLGICSYFIEELESYANTDKNDGLRPNYGTASTACIPLRVMLGDLYLYRGSFLGKDNANSKSDFEKAVIYYHDFLNFNGQEKCTKLLSNEILTWDDTFRKISDSNDANGSSSSFQYGVVPMDSIAYYSGTYSELLSVFNSTPGNNYYASASPSARLLEISNAQKFTKRISSGSNKIDTVVGRPTLEEIASNDRSDNGGQSDARIKYGDLRFQKYYNPYSISDLYNSDLATNRQSILKYASSNQITTNARLSSVTLMRNLTVYYHLCEALNRAGFPETAFAMLKYGISNTILQDSTKVSTDEYTRLQALTSVGMPSNAASWDEDYFLTYDRFVGGGSHTPKNTSTEIKNPNQWALHAVGSGDVYANEGYYLPTDSSGIVEVPVDTFTQANLLTKEDSLAHDDLLKKIAEQKATNANWLASDLVRNQRIAEVDKLLIDEYALEFAYEGTRFYDLMRYTKYYNNGYLGEAISKRAGESNTNGTLSSKLSSESGWYLPLPTE